MLDDLDRQIVGVLIRDGRATWRLAAEVLGQQERTVARRGNRLLASGALRIEAYPSPQALAPVDFYLLRVDTAPSALRGVASWLADHPGTHWVSALAGSSGCVVELYAQEQDLGSLLYGELAELEGVQGFSLDPIFQYYRTVSGWRPDVLTPEQHEALDASAQERYATLYDARHQGPLDQQNRRLLGLLRPNGRATMEELAAGLSVSKATASRRLDSLISSGAVLVRAILDPALIGYPIETLVTIDGAADGIDATGRAVADMPSTRWAANVSGRVLVQVAARSIPHLHSIIKQINARPQVSSVGHSMYAEIFKRTTVTYRDGELPPLDAS